MITYAPKSVTDAVKSRPDWPELETAMKRAYGADWRLVSYDEPMHPAEGRRKERKMAMGYIDREEAMRAIDEYKGYFQGQISTSNLLTKIEAQCIISDLDDADVAPVRHGRWAHLGGDEWCCTNCGNVINTEGSWEQPYQKYCDECGAKMDKED